MEANTGLACHSTIMQGKQEQSLNPFTLQNRQTFPLKGQVINISGLVGHAFSV